MLQLWCWCVCNVL